MTISPQEFLERKDEYLPALPATAARVLAVTADPESSADELMQAVLPDQSMCAAILKIANSAFLGIPRGAGSIKQAVVILGQTEIRNLVIARAVCNAFPLLDKKQMAEADLFWEHSFSCGLLCMILAPEFRENPGELFLAGLIHDIGKLPLLLAFPDKALDLHILSRCNSIASEKSTFGTTHEQIGLNLTYRWLFPSKLIAAVAWHHRFMDAPGHTEIPLLVNLAENLVLLAKEDVSGEEAVARLSSSHPDTVQECSHRGVELTAAAVDSWFEELEQRKVDDQLILDTLRF